jgi:hypothetical protein
MRTFLVLGLILLAAVMPLVAISVGTIVFEPGLPSARAFESPAAPTPSVALLALAFFRAPPSR